MWPALERMFEAAGLPGPDLAFDVRAGLPMLEVVAESDLVGFMSWEVLRREKSRVRVTQLDVKGARLSRQVGVSYRKDAYLSATVLRFIEIVKSTAKLDTYATLAP